MGLEGRERMQIIALLMIAGSAAGAWRLPVTIEVKQDVKVTDNPKRSFVVARSI